MIKTNPMVVVYSFSTLNSFIKAISGQVFFMEEAEGLEKLVPYTMESGMMIRSTVLA